MKVVQVGILAALIVVAGLLYKVYQQGTPSGPEAAPAVANVSTPPAPAETATAPVPEKPAAEAVPVKSEPVERKPSPAPRPKSRAAKREAPVEIAQAPSAPAPVQAEQPAAPVPPPPAAPAPVEEPAARPAPGALNPPPGTQAAPREPHHVVIPAGTLIPVRLVESLSSDRNQAGDTFTATLDQPLVIDGFVIAERGSRFEGRVLEAEKAGRVKGVASLGIQLVRMHTSDGQTVDILTERFLKEGVASKGEDAKKIGVGAAIGAAIGAIAGGGKGAAIGAGVGGAAGTGTVMATRGKPAELPTETRISFKLQDAVSLTEKLK